MITLPLIVLIPLITFSLCFLALVILIAHRLRPLLGLSPLLILLGVMAGVLVFPLFPFVQINIGSQELTISVITFVFLPVLLMGLLVIYVIDGTTQARAALIGILAAVILSTGINIISSLAPSWGKSPLELSVIWDGLRQLIASLLAFAADLFILVIAYQWMSNLHKHQPKCFTYFLCFYSALPDSQDKYVFSKHLASFPQCYAPGGD